MIVKNGISLISSLVAFLKRCYVTFAGGCRVNLHKEKELHELGGKMLMFERTANQNVLN